MVSEIVSGDCLEVLRTLKGNTYDALVTDPPAGIAFMGKEWDEDKGGRKQWVAWMTDVMREALRVLKPGAHGLVWALPRTSHWTATALEDAGFEIRDVVTHLFGTGFPKSLNVEKAGAGNQWQGWGTALKPASEHWILVRKPCSEKTVAANVQKWGTGALNIDACRIEGAKRSPEFRNPNSELGYQGGSSNKALVNWDASQGRFPANLVLDEEAAAALDEQSGERPTGGYPAEGVQRTHNGIYGKPSVKGPAKFGGSSGGASRFFYVAKASKKDKGPDNTHPTVKSTELMSYLIKLVTPPNGVVLDPFMGSGSTGVAAAESSFRFYGIEQNPEYVAIAKARVFHSFPLMHKEYFIEK